MASFQAWLAISLHLNQFLLRLFSPIQCTESMTPKLQENQPRLILILMSVFWTNLIILQCPHCNSGRSSQMYVQTDTICILPLSLICPQILIGNVGPRGPGYCNRATSGSQWISARELTNRIVPRFLSYPLMTRRSWKPK